jgi:hypothetical protein
MLDQMAGEMRRAVEMALAGHPPGRDAEVCARVFGEAPTYGGNAKGMLLFARIALAAVAVARAAGIHPRDVWRSWRETVLRPLLDGNLATDADRDAWAAMELDLLRAAMED